MSDEDVQRLRRTARAEGKDPREAAAELLGTEPGRFVALCSSRCGPTSRPVFVRWEPSHQDYRVRAWVAPLLRLEDLLSLAVLAGEAEPPVSVFDSFCTILDTKTGRLVCDLGRRSGIVRLEDAPEEEGRS